MLIFIRVFLLVNTLALHQSEVVRVEVLKIFLLHRLVGLIIVIVKVVVVIIVV